MLQITIPETELFDENTLEFIKVKKHTLNLEHSLVSISKWESKWNKPFLSTKDKTSEEDIDYIRCMTITQNVDPNLYLALPNYVYEKVEKYIDEPMTASWVSDNGKHKTTNEVITSETIYYWMISLQIPVDFQRWHLNRLLALIQYCSIKNAPEKKMTKAETLKMYKDLNEKRKREINTKG